VFDLRQMTFVDVSGLRLLTRGHETARARNGRARLAAPSPQTRKLLAILKLDTTLEVFDTLSEALLAPMAAGPTAPTAPTARASNLSAPVLGPRHSPHERRLRIRHGRGRNGRRHRPTPRPRIGGG
jgi:STAS domain